MNLFLKGHSEERRNLPLDIQNKCSYNNPIERQNIYSNMIQEVMSYDDHKRYHKPGYI